MERLPLIVAGLHRGLYRDSIGMYGLQSVCNEVSGSFTSVQPSIDSLDGKIIRSNVSAPHKLSKAEKKNDLTGNYGKLATHFLKIGFPWDRL